MYGGGVLGRFRCSGNCASFDNPDSEVSGKHVMQLRQLSGRLGPFVGLVGRLRVVAVNSSLMGRCGVRDRGLWRRRAGRDVEHAHHHREDHDPADDEDEDEHHAGLPSRRSTGGSPRKWAELALHVGFSGLVAEWGEFDVADGQRRVKIDVGEPDCLHHA